MKILTHPTSGKQFRMGRRRPITRRGLKLRNYLRRGFPAPPKKISYAASAMASLNQVYLNDQLGDCVIAGMAHIMGVLTGNAGSVQLFTDAQITSMYSAIGGYVPGKPDTDQGCAESTAFAYWQENGFVTPDDKIAGSLLVNGADIEEVKIALWLFENCLAGDTRIPLLDGSTPTIEELSRRPEACFWVYSCDQDGNIVPGLAHSARLTGKSKELISVLLDNGEEIVCTPDHLFLLRDGSYAEARKLQTGTSLMPLYRRLAWNGSPGYEQVLNPATSAWNFTHRLVASHCCGGSYDAEVIHHINLNKRDNRPENLKPMKWDDHVALHSKLTDAMVLASRSQEGRERASRRMKALWAERREEMLSHARANSGLEAEFKRRRESGEPMPWELRDPNWLREQGKRLGLLGKGRKKSKSVGEKVARTLKSLMQDPEVLAVYRSNAMKASVAAREKRLRDGPSEKQRAYLNRNHRVVSISQYGIGDVYDLSVDKHHNFATAAGAFVHNCSFGMELPHAWIDPFPAASGFVWRSAGSYGPDPNNGHFVAGVGYDQSGNIQIATWGMLGWITRQAVARYAVSSAQGDVHTVLSRQSIVKASGVAPNGFNWSQLLADFQALA